MHHQNFTSCFRNVKGIILFTIISVFVLGTHADDSYVIASTHPPQTIGISKSSPRVVLGLDYPNSFEMTLTNLGSQSYDFCETYPSEVTSKLQTEVEIKFPGIFSFDNIVSYKGYNFLVDTSSLYILAVEESQNSPAQYIIKSPSNNTKTGNEFDEVFVTIDEDNGIIFIITKKVLLSYELNLFIEAIKAKRPFSPPKTAKNFNQVSSVNNVRFYKNNLYIVADNIVHIYLTAPNGDVAPLKTRFDEEFLKVEALSITDIAFYQNQAFVLDSIKGLYAVNVEGASQSNFINLGIYHEIEKGIFIEIIKNSINIVTSSKKATKLYEFIISTKTSKPVLNRVLEIFQAVSDIYADDNFLYLITGFFNMVVRPLVPGNFDSEFVEGYVMNYWSLFDIKAMSTRENGAKSQIVAVQSKTVSYYSFEPESPAIQCDIETVPEGEYMYQLKVLQSTCAEKSSDDINVICQTKQNIRFVIAESSSIGDVSGSYKITLGLIAGLGVMAILIIIFCVLVRKYKKQYQVLESQFKFRKLKEEGGQDVGEGSKPEEYTA